MMVELHTRRRAVSIAYGRYIEADRRWRASLETALEWFPDKVHPRHAVLGNPGSRVRMRYEDRDRALKRLDAALLKLKIAKQRLTKMREKRNSPVYLISAVPI